MTTSTITFTNALTGDALIAKVNEMGDASKSDLVRACGYVSLKDDGTERLNFVAFYDALLTAKGLTPAESSDVEGVNSDDEGNTCYVVKVPVYAELFVYRKEGLSDEELLKSVTVDDIYEATNEYIGESIEEKIKKNIGPSVPCEVIVDELG